MFNVVLSVLVIFSIILPLNLFAQKFVCILNNVITLISSWYFVQLLHFIEQLSQDKCYRYAIADNIKYDLLFRDANVQDMFKYYSVFTDTLPAGDIIFMGEEDNNDMPTHIGIYIKTIGNNIYFIDATQGKIEQETHFNNTFNDSFGNIKYMRLFYCLLLH